MINPKIAAPGAAVLAAAWFLAAPAAPASGPVYDPLAVPDAANVSVLDLTVRDEARGREIPIRVYLAPGAAAAPVILFSHGLGGTREGSAFLGRHWAARGYAAVFLQHPGSDDSVWRKARLPRRRAEMKKAASLENFLLRVRDVSAVLDRLERWNAAGGHPLSGRLDPARVGMSGHSFGAVTTQAVAGEQYAARGASFADPRIKAAVIMSPSRPRGADPEKAFARVKIPWMIMTGTKDSAVIVDAEPESRLEVFPALPPGGKYELVLDKAEHSAFTDRALPGDKEPRNPNHHRAILALSTAFWDAWLRGDEAARAWLDGDGPASVLENADRWRKK